MKRLFCLLILLTAGAYGQGSFSGQQVLTDNNGRPLGGAIIKTYSDNLCTVPTTTWKDQALTLPQASLVTDGLGNFSFWGPTGFVFYTPSGTSISGTACFPVQLPSLGGGAVTPTGTGFVHVISGVQDGTAKTIDVSSGDITGVLKASAEPAHTGDMTNSAGSLATTVASAASVKNVGNVLYAAQFAGSSTTCGVLEAYNALPAGGGTIILQLGNCSGSGWPVTITKPIVIQGQGMGGPIDAGFNANVIAGSSLTNTSTGGSFFILSIPGTVGISSEGITFRDFAMIGNKTVGVATAGDCVDINGGTSTEQVRAIRFDNIQCNQPKSSGFVIKDNAFMITFTNVHVTQSGSHCLVIKDGVNGGIPSQIHIIASTLDLCGGNNASFLPGTADGLNISGTTARSVDITNSTMADSNNGINVVAGATAASIHVLASDFESNTTCDISLNDGLLHRISSSTLFGGGTFGLHGVCTNMPAGAPAQQEQLFMDANWFGSHTSQDVLIGANQKTGFILPQNSNIYTYSDASGNVVKLDATTFAGLNFTGNFFSPGANGTGGLGQAGAFWASIFIFAGHLSESTPTAGAANQTVFFGDSGDHMWKYNPNNAGIQHVPQSYRLAAQYTNSTTGFTTVGTPNIAFPVNANESYIADCHLYYQAALTGGLNIQFTGPAAPTAVIYGLTEPVALGTSDASVATAFGTSLGNVVTTATTNFDAAVSFSLINGVNAGTVTLQAKSSAAAQLQIQAGSFCQVQ